MNTTDHHELLQAYAQDHSEFAFQELVQRYVDLVYSAAIRRVSGDRELAEDVTQEVFTDLARKAAALPPTVMLGGWLHRHTGYVASTAMRGEQRRRDYERQAVEMNALNEPSDADWSQFAPVLDEAMDEMDAADRDALVLRYFERCELREVGAALGVSDDTAQKRVSRALEKLRQQLARRGITSPATALSAAIIANAVQAAPAGLAATISSTVLLTGTAISSTVTATKAIAMTTLQKAFAGAVLLMCVALAGLGLRSFGPHLITAHRTPRPAFALKGTFTDEFANKPHSSGTFEVRASGLMALIDTEFKHGYREFVGTDGRDTFQYAPFSADKAVEDPHSLATISSGRFPANGSFYSQILWLAVTGDQDMLRNLQAFNCHFYGDYRPDEITTSIATVENQPQLLTSVKWYAPHTMALGEARYDLALYPGGWLTAELSVTYTNASNNAYLPTHASFTRYAMFAVKNAAQSSELHPRQRDDVQILERTEYLVTDARVESPLSTYVPEIVDKTAVVNDKRIGRTVQLGSSGRWWAVRELLAGQKQTSR